MIRFAEQILFTLMLCSLGNALHADVTVPFELINGLIVVEAELNGTTGNYIIDSGSNGIILNGFSKKSSVSYQTLTTAIEGSETKIETFKVGEFQVNELLGLSTDLSNLESYLSKEVDGILGCSIFTPSSLIFDFGQSNMIISDSGLNQAELKGLLSLSFSIVDELPLVELEIGNKTQTFILDSGASSHFIDQKVLDMNSDNVIQTGVEKSIITAGGTTERSLEYKISNCKFGSTDRSINAFQMDFKLLSNTLGKEISGLLSLSNLSSSKVYFDLKSKKLYYN